MNRERRSKLSDALDHLERAKTIIEDVKWDEEMALDNMPENLQNSDRYSAMEDAVSDMEDAISNVEDAQECLEKVLE